MIFFVVCESTAAHMLKSQDASVFRFQLVVFNPRYSLSPLYWRSRDWSRSCYMVIWKCVSMHLIGQHCVTGWCCAKSWARLNCFLDDPALFCQSPLHWLPHCSIAVGFITETRLNNSPDYNLPKLSTHNKALHLSLTYLKLLNNFVPIKQLSHWHAFQSLSCFISPLYKERSHLCECVMYGWDRVLHCWQGPAARLR